jgi:hypothetical protein
MNLLISIITLVDAAKLQLQIYTTKRWLLPDCVEKLSKHSIPFFERFFCGNTCKCYKQALKKFVQVNFKKQYYI